MSRENSPISSNTEAKETCPICGGMGLVTRNVPVGHPDFGKAFVCVCQRDIVAARRASQLVTLSNLDSVADKTFDNFSLEPPGGLTPEELGTLKEVYQQVRRYAEQPSGWLFFQGSFGSGKTHLAAAVANYRLAQGDHVMFVTAPDLLDHLRSAYAPSSEIEYDELFERVREVPLLILDDLGAESSTPWAQEKLYQLINHRYQNKLPTVLTTNRDPTEIEPRIRSRILDWELTQKVNLYLPDYRRGNVTNESNSASNLSLYGDMIFESFEPRPSLPENEQQNLHNAFQTAVAYAKSPQGWLAFLGPNGCGKTHLAAAIGNYRQRHGDSVILMTVPDLLDYLRAAFSGGTGISLDKRFRELQTVSLLILDQLDLRNATPWALEKIRQLADHRYLSRLPTLFTTTQHIEEIDPMLQSRLLDKRNCRVIGIIAPDYRGGDSGTPAKRQGRNRRNLLD